MSAESAVECRSLGRRFRQTAAVSSLSFSVARGEVFGLIGPDGAGKTTTFRMLACILPPTSGSASVLGFDVRQDAEAIKRRIGYMSQRFSLYGDLTVAENLNFTADLFQVPPTDRGPRIDRLLEASRLAPFGSRLAQNLSGGMKQKLALACALVHTPQVLLLDEPTTGVDPVSRRDFWSILYGLVGEGMTLVVSTPYMDEAVRCHRVALMDGGRALLEGTPDELRRQMRAAVLEVHTKQALQARRALQPIPEVRSVEAFGDRLHVVLAEGKSESVLTDLFRRHAITVDSVRQVPATLEDVFISLVGASPIPESPARPLT